MTMHSPRRAAPLRLSIGLAATRLAQALAAGDVLFVASDEQRAEAVAAALAAASPGAAVIHCPSSDALPGDRAPASPGNVGQRLAALRRLRLLQGQKERAPLALVTTAEAAARLYPTPASFDAAPPTLAVGQGIDLAALEISLLEIGYFADDRVDEPGEMAIRGQVIDLFPADAGLPARIAFEEGRIVSIRAYDPVTQTGGAEIERLEIGRVAEPPVALPDSATVFDHVPGAAIALDPDAGDRRDRYRVLALEAVRGQADNGAAIPLDAWDAACAAHPAIDLLPGDEIEMPRFVEQRAPLRALARLAKPLLEDGARMVVAGSARDLRFLGMRLGRSLGLELGSVESWQEAIEAPPGSAVRLVLPIDRGWQAPGLIVVAAADLLGSRALIADADAPSVDPWAGGGEIRIGDVVVHEDYGIGVVAGLEALPATAGEATGAGDAIALEYAAGGRRLVPVAEADRIWRYGADQDAVTLDRLDGSSWEKRRGAIDAAIAESARALTALAAERAERTTAVLDPDPAAYERFAAGFPFTETADQARAITAVRDDLASGRPVDRLVIGDVGYGKTEVAMRAAALAALAGRQVAIAAPTTVLVRQHLETFGKRFAGTGIAVAGLSRLSSAGEKKAVKAGLADGSIGIVIGTAAVAAKGVAYADLGLVIVDEEQRFGAADKARLRALTDGHVLTLSATPIPRTLQSALVGLQQVSVIATPPARRQPIRTDIDIFDPRKVRIALIREKGRGGQSFVVVPRIEDMAAMAETLGSLVPELRIAQAHGKMPAGEIDAAMVGFANGEGDVLLATNIIEAGLDVPRANTMIVWRADRFGLSQLHQLRGRVGRGSRRGQVLLLTDPEARIAEATIKRLRALQAFDRLGAGFAISARDLDMRGAGDLLGEAQAGHMKLIGIDLYQHLLEGALRAARGEAVDRWAPELHLGLSGSLPEMWIPDVEVRVVLYGRLARIAGGAALDAFEAEIEDRFGPPPPEVRWLLEYARIRLLAREARVARIDAGPAAIALRPRPDFTGDAAAAGLAAKDGRLLLSERIAAPEDRLERLRILLEALAD